MGNNDLIFKLLEIVFIVLGTLIGRYLVPWIKLKLDIARMAKFTQYAKECVEAAEQMIQGKGLGAEKREKVISWLVKGSDKFGLDLTEEEIRILMESLVFAMKQDKNKEN